MFSFYGKGILLYSGRFLASLEINVEMLLYLDFGIYLEFNESFSF